MRIFGWLLLALLPAAATAQTTSSALHRFRVEKVVEGIDRPWAIAIYIVYDDPGQVVRLVPAD